MNLKYLRNHRVRADHAAPKERARVLWGSQQGVKISPDALSPILRRATNSHGRSCPKRFQETGGMHTPRLSRTSRLGDRVHDQWGSFVGPENSAVENAVTLACATLGSLFSVELARRRALDGRRQVAIALMSLDLWGGAAANNTRSCARWYERPGQGLTAHLGFAAAHLHPLLLAWVDRTPRQGRRRRWWALTQYGYLLLATWVVRRFAGRHRRLAGLLTTAGGIVLDRAVGPSPAAPWFAPVFHVKLLLGHASAALWSDPQLRIG